MKTVLAIAAAASVAASAYAQLSTVPAVGVAINPAQSQWAASQLPDYYFGTDNNLGTPNMALSGDNTAAHLSWSHSVNSNALTSLNALNTLGGTVQTIFLGESAGWRNNFGFTLDGSASDATSSSIFKDIQAYSAKPPVTVHSGDYADITLSPNDASTFDLWLDAVGNQPANTDGGVYYAIHQGNSAPFILPGNILWSTTPLVVNTFVQSLNNGAGGYENVDTYLVGFEDWNLNTADKDYNDFVFGVQFLNRDGTPAGNPVPEPSTYGLIGAAALLGVVARRRFAKKK